MSNRMEVSNVSKSYGSFKALKNVSFVVEEASLFAFLGPNGAGKSTMIDILCTLKKADKGNVKIDGFLSGIHDEEIRRRIGVVFQNSMLDDLLTVEENLMSRCGCYQMFHQAAKKRIRELDKMIGLQDILYQKTATLSGGQRRRVDIARALLTNPKILILDEPTTGLDPASRNSIWNMIHDLQKSQKMTIFLTTHYLEEAKHAHQVCLLKEGRIMMQGTPQYIRETYAKNHLFLYSDRLSQLAYQLQMLHIAYTSYFDHLDIQVRDSKQALSILKRAELYIHNFEYVNGTLEDAFLQMMEGDDSHVRTDSR